MSPHFVNDNGSPPPPPNKTKIFQSFHLIQKQSAKSQMAALQSTLRALHHPGSERPKAFLGSTQGEL